MKKILLVDNVKSILDRQKSLLNRDVFQVSIAESAQEAIDLHKKEQFDLILMDMNMPGMDGAQACRAIRSDPSMKKVSILMATLTDTKEEVQKAMDSGANGHIKKPLKKEDLDQKVAALLNIPTRQSIRILVRIKLDAKIGGDFFIANTVDVSSTGLLFECDHDLKSGDSVETSFFLPSPEGFKRVVAQSEVMRVAPGANSTAKRYGVRFVDFKEGNNDFINRFVREKTGKA